MIEKWIKKITGQNDAVPDEMSAPPTKYEVPSLPQDIPISPVPAEPEKPKTEDVRQPLITGDKDQFPYHRAKEIIEQARTEYESGMKDAQLPPIIYSRQEKTSEIKFDIADDADVINLLTAIVQTIGKSDIVSYTQDSLNVSQKDGLSIWLKVNSRYYAPAIRFNTTRDFNSQEIEAIIKAYKLANPGNEAAPSPEKILKSLGATIYNPEDAPAWEYIAGYEDAKQQVKDTIILPFQHPEIYEQIAQKTRRNMESNRPKAVLFEGPPGTGKTTMARLIAGEVKANLVYVPIESIMSKWYGESEQNLADIFTTCQDLGNTLLFLDEIDSLATSRDHDTHEATRRVLSVLLRKIDGFIPNKGTILIGATNRKNDLDPALLSRFDTSIEFPLPDKDERQAIFKNYAQHLCDTDLAVLAEKGEGLSGRDIKNLCERVERGWASELINRGTQVGEAPPVNHYVAWVEKR